MTVTMLFLMAYQVTGEMLHEWIGIAMTVLVITHHILNRKWHASLFKGKYNPYRSATSAASILLTASFALTAFCGMAMSGYAVPFLYGMAPVSFARRFHLSMSHWSFVLMGIHLGLHIPVIFAKLRQKKTLMTVLTVLFTLASGYGLYLFLQNKIPDYMFFRTPFAFLDYEKPKALVIGENFLMLIFWVFSGTQIAELCTGRGKEKSRILPVVLLLAAVVTALLLSRLAGDPGAAASEGNWMEQGW